MKILSVYRSVVYNLELNTVVDVVKELFFSNLSLLLSAK